MPATEILVFREANGRIPMEDWLDLLSHGIMKRQKVPDAEIRRAAERKRLVLADPQRYSFRLVPKEV